MAGSLVRCVDRIQRVQFADDKIRALGEAGRVSRDLVVVVIPARVPESGIAAVFKPLVPLFPPEALESMKHSGMFALSEPGKLDDLLTATGLRVQDDDEVDCPVCFGAPEAAAHAFLAAGPMQLAIQQSGEQATAQAVREALTAYTEPDGRVILPAWYRAVIARTEASTSRGSA